ncbi:MAG: purine-nucleoside phosphorylase [Nautiliaceae bacterium]
MIISAGNEEVFEFATPIGVGLIESTINLTQLCLFNKPDFLIFIGSAGSYGKLKPFEVIESFSASNIEHCFLQKRCYTPIDNIISIKPSILINSSNYITTDKTISKAYLSLGIDGENMEFYSVMRVAKEFGIGVIGIFVITNYCFEEAHKEYLQNIKKAKQTLTEYLMDKKLIKGNNG